MKENNPCTSDAIFMAISVHFYLFYPISRPNSFDADDKLKVICVQSGGAGVTKRGICASDIVIIKNGNIL